VEGGSADLVIIDGAPGVEKRSIVTALVRLTGYRLFDNDISISIDWALTACSWECYQLPITPIRSTLGALIFQEFSCGASLRQHRCASWHSPCVVVDECGGLIGLRRLPWGAR
jgi:hypothetical protein